MKNERGVIKEKKGGKGKRDKREWDGEGKQAAGRMEEGGSNEGKRDGSMFYSLTAYTPLITAAKKSGGV